MLAELILTFFHIAKITLCKYNRVIFVLLKVSIYLPPLKMLKSVVDRMKNISGYLVSDCLLQ